MKVLITCYLLLRSRFVFQFIEILLKVLTFFKMLTPGSVIDFN